MDNLLWYPSSRLPLNRSDFSTSSLITKADDPDQDASVYRTGRYNLYYRVYSERFRQSCHP